MLNKIISLIVCLLVCCVAFGNSFSSGYVITKDDRDSSVNLRDKESLHSKVLAKISNGTPMSCSFDASNNSDFCFVKFDEKNLINTGFIHKTRLLFLDNDKSFNKIPLINSDLYSALYKNNQVSVKIKLVFSKLNKKDFSWLKESGVATLTYQGEKVYGTDNQIIDSVFLYSVIDVEKNGEKYTIPSTQFQGLFIPSYFIENKLFFKNISIYYNTQDDLLYIFSTQADGAAIYTVVFELKNNLPVKTAIWLESY